MKAEHWFTILFLTGVIIIAVGYFTRGVQPKETPKKLDSLDKTRKELNEMFPRVS